MPNEMHACEVHAHEMHAYEMHTHKVQGHETHARKMHAHETRAYEVNPYEMYWEGIGFVEDNNNDDRPWGRKGTLPYTLACMVKSGSSPTSTVTTKREEKGEKDACWLPELGCLATYVGYVPCVSTCLY
jgi:hypothetical protein